MTAKSRVYIHSNSECPSLCMFASAGVSQPACSGHSVGAFTVAVVIHGEGSGIKAGTKGKDLFLGSTLL